MEALFSEDHAFSEREVMLLEHLVDNEIIDYSTYMKLYDDTIEVDYQLIGEQLVITDDYMALITDGTFRPYAGDD